MDIHQSINTVKQQLQTFKFRLTQNQTQNELVFENIVASTENTKLKIFNNNDNNNQKPITSINTQKKENIKINDKQCSVQMGDQKSQKNKDIQECQNCKKVLKAQQQQYHANLVEFKNWKLNRQKEMSKKQQNYEDNLEEFKRTKEILKNKNK